VAPDCAQQRGAGATSELERDPSPLWRALDEAINQRDGKQRLQALVDELEKAGYTAAAKMPRRPSGRARGSPALPGQATPPVAIDQPARRVARRG
jgi:hypothetical protein